MKKATYFYLLRRGFFGGGNQNGVDDYISRVEADGGTFEGLRCLNNAVRSLRLIPVPFLVVIQAFQTRVTDDSGTFEGFSCVLGYVEQLGNINL